MTLVWDNLVGVPFHMGIDDCFALTRKFFAQNFDLHIKDYARPSDWDADKLNLIERFFELEGFEKLTNWKIKDLRPGDVLCMAISSSNPNHFAVYVGDNTLVHHIANRLSTEEPLRGFWRNMTCFVVRHPSIPDLRPAYPDAELTELLRARLDFAPPPEQPE